MQKCSVWVQQAPPAAQWSRAGAAEPTLKGREADLTHRGCGAVRGTPISRQFTCRWVLKHNRFISHEEGKERCRTRLRPTQLSCLSFKPRAPQPPLQDDRRPESTFWHSCLSPVTAAARPVCSHSGHALLLQGIQALASRSPPEHPRPSGGANGSAATV